MHIHMQTLQHTCIPHFCHRRSCHTRSAVKTHSAHEHAWTTINFVFTSRKNLKLLTLGFNVRNQIFFWNTGAYKHSIQTIVYAGLHLCISRHWWQSDTQKTLHWDPLVWSTRTGHNPLMMGKKRNSNETVCFMIIHTFLAVQISWYIQVIRGKASSTLVEAQATGMFKG